MRRRLVVVLGIVLVAAASCETGDLNPQPVPPLDPKDAGGRGGLGGVGGAQSGASGAGGSGAVGGSGGGGDGRRRWRRGKRRKRRHGWNGWRSGIGRRKRLWRRAPMRLPMRPATPLMRVVGTLMQVTQKEGWATPTRTRGEKYSEQLAPTSTPGGCVKLCREPNG